eukprot:10096088-Ditylum_brightwellii.AAC.1
MSSDGGDVLIQNCMIVSPAHFGCIQHNSILQGAKMPGFTGVASTITESANVAMDHGLYGLFSPSPPLPPTVE